AGGQGRITGPRGFPGREERLGLHHHAGAAAVGLVVRGAVLVAGEVADLVHVHAQQPLIASAPEDARLEHAGKDLGKKGEDVEFHLQVPVSFFRRQRVILRSPWYPAEKEKSRPGQAWISFLSSALLTR